MGVYLSMWVHVSSFLLISVCCDSVLSRNVECVCMSPHAWKNCMYVKSVYFFHIRSSGVGWGRLQGRLMWGKVNSPEV